jgi:hypothetical protein
VNWRPSAPRASGLVCSGDRLVITLSQSRGSSETAREAPDRVALDGELGLPYALLSVGDGDVPKLRVGAHDLLGHLLEGVLLLLNLLLESLPLLLGLLHPLLGRLLDGCCCSACPER